MGRIMFKPYDVDPQVGRPLLVKPVKGATYKIPMGMVYLPTFAIYKHQLNSGYRKNIQNTNAFFFWRNETLLLPINIFLRVFC